MNAVRGFDLAGRVESAVRDRVDARHDAVLVAIGKSAAVMAAGAMRVVRPSAVVVARPTRALALADDVRDAITARGASIDEFATGHPVPDGESVRAATRVREVVSRADETTPVIVLVSGGASAALCLPRSGLSLDDYAQTVKSLLAAGLPIESVNALRGRLDAMKHGGLARFARGTVHTLVAADVLGEGAHVIAAVGSGPTVASDEAVIDADLLAKLPARVRDIAMRDDESTRATTTTPVLVAKPHDLRATVASQLARHFAVEILPDGRGDVADLAAQYGERIGRLERRHALVAVGEPTVVLPAHPGRGGRAGRLALLVASALSKRAGSAFLAAASDGVDGESGHAGAVVDDATLGALAPARIDPSANLAAFDDASAHEAVGTAIDVGPTGLNLLDVHVIARLDAE